MGVLRHLEEAKREGDAKKMREMGKGRKLIVEGTHVCSSICWKIDARKGAGWNRMWTGRKKIRSK